jgi:hypothetical protein
MSCGGDLAELRDPISIEIAVGSHPRLAASSAGSVHRVTGENVRAFIERAVSGKLIRVVPPERQQAAMVAKASSVKASAGNDHGPATVVAREAARVGSACIAARIRTRRSIASGPKS